MASGKCGSRWSTFFRHLLKSLNFSKFGEVQDGPGWLLGALGAGGLGDSQGDLRTSGADLGTSWVELRTSWDDLMGRSCGLLGASGAVWEGKNI